MKNFLMLMVVIGCSFFLSCGGDRMDSPSDKFSVEIVRNEDSYVLRLTSLGSEINLVRLGIKLNEVDLALKLEENLKITEVEKNNKFNEFLLQQGANPITVRLRLYDDALAFRYEGNNASALHVEKELSAWTLPEATTVWYFERRNDWKLKSYAGTWEHCRLSELVDVASSPVQGLPVVFETVNGHFGFISEAGLENYSGLRLKVDKDCTLTADFTEGEKGFDVPAHFKSPWRVLFMGADLDALVNQSVIKELSPQPDPELFADQSYIQPGKCAWRWFAKGTGTPEEEREVIDAAARMNFRYSLIDDGWKHWPDCWSEARALVEYAHSKGVRLLFWQHSKPLRNTTDDYAGMRNFLDSIADIGAAGVKVDFMDSEAQSLIDFEIRLLKECARRSLVVNFHGCHQPAGESFTYPNELTREGIRGMELNKMREGYIPAYHNAALPFTRFVAGHGDYTPLSFTVPGTTTFAHQLATLVCFHSPLQTIAEDPDLLLNNPQVKLAAGFIRDVPTIWDEVRVLPQSEIGKLAVLAKRSGKNWYIGVLNGESVEKKIELDLSPFMQPSDKVVGYIDDLIAEKVLLSMDGHRPGVLKRVPVVPFKVEKDRLNLQQLKLAPEGGAVLVIK